MSWSDRDAVTRKGPRQAWRTWREVKGGGCCGDASRSRSPCNVHVRTLSFKKEDVVGQAWLPSQHMQNQHAKFLATGGVKIAGGVAFRRGWWTRMLQHWFFFPWLHCRHLLWPWGCFQIFFFLLYLCSLLRLCFLGQGASLTTCT